MIDFTEVRRGYDKEEVAAYFDKVAKEYETLYTEYKKAEAELNSLKEKSTSLALPPNKIEIIAMSIFDAETKAQQIVSAARQKAWQIITDAKKGLDTYDSYEDVFDDIEESEPQKVSEDVTSTAEVHSKNVEFAEFESHGDDEVVTDDKIVDDKKTVSDNDAVNDIISDLRRRGSYDNSEYDEPDLGGTRHVAPPVVHSKDTKDEPTDVKFTTASTTSKPQKQQKIKRQSDPDMSDDLMEKKIKDLERRINRAIAGGAE